MSEVTIAIVLVLCFAVLLVWLLRPHGQPGETSGAPLDPKLENVFTKHYRFFPQIRRALSSDDDEYLREMASPKVAQQVSRERRAVARRFLGGLHEDFSGLERLGRMIASLSPEVSREQETERFLLGVRFRVLYALVWLRLSTGSVPLRQIELLTELVGRLALRMEEAMAEINALSADQFPRGINA